MTIRLTNPMHAIEVDPPRPPTTYHLVFVGNQVVALADTEAEALEAKRAFENVLAPRFTRDEAIAIVKEAIPLSPWADVTGPSIEMVRGIRLALEALAVAGAFVDSDPCPWCAANREVTPDPGSACETCDGSGRLRTMADKLDAAGIK